MIRDEGLRRYADLLAANGFAIYEPIGSMGTYFTYSRMVDDRECFGTVQAERFGGYTHTMPIRPSIEHGSSMWVEKLPGQRDATNDGSNEALTVAVAKMVAKPANRNALVGKQENYRDPSWLDRGFVKWAITVVAG